MDRSEATRVVRFGYGAVLLVGIMLALSTGFEQNGAAQ